MYFQYFYLHLIIVIKDFLGFSILNGLIELYFKYLLHVLSTHFVLIKQLNSIKVQLNIPGKNYHLFTKFL